MAWLFLCLSLFLSPDIQAQHPLLLKQSRQQVRQYVQAIQQGKNVDLNLWALAELNQAKPEIQSYLRTYTSKRLDTPALKVFQDTTLSLSDQLKQLAFTAKSPFLLVAYLLAESNSKAKNETIHQFSQEIGFQTSDINYQKLMEALLHGQKITPDLLPADHFNPIHFLLFFDNNLIRNNSFSAGYFLKAAKEWNQNNTYGKLGHSLYLFTLFRTYYLLDQYDQIDPLYGEITNNRNFPISIQKLSVLRMMDYSMYRLGFYNRSINIIRNYALPLAQYFNQAETAAKIHMAQGSYLYYIGKIEESKGVYLEIQKDIKSEHVNISQAKILNNLAVNYFKSGEFDKYINLLFKGLQEAKKEDNYGLKLDILKNLYIYYHVNKDYKSAKQYLNQAKKLAKQKQNNKDLAQLSYYEGELYQDSESNYDRAITFFNKALAYVSYQGDYTSYQHILTKKALLLEKQTKYEEAKIIYQGVLQHAGEHDDQRNLLYASFNKANTYLELGQTDSARIVLDTLKTKPLDALAFYQLVKARTVQARYQQTTGRLGDGAQILQPVIAQILKRSRGSGDMETGFWQVEPEYLNAFELYANLLIKNHQPAKAVEALDQLKTINDAALYQDPLVRSKVLNEKELSQYKRFSDQLDELRRQLLATKAGRDKINIQQQINELSAKKNALDQKITSAANRTPVSVRQIQHRMDAHQCVLHITELNDTYYVAVISRTAIHFKKIPLTSKLRSQFKNSIAEIAYGNTDLTKLYVFTKLLGLQNLPSQVHQLTIIPDSYLYQLPMDVLPLTPPDSPQSYGGAHYLIERYKTNYMTSLNDFNKQSQKLHYKYGFTGYGISTFAADRTTLIPLPEAKTEIKSISEQLTALQNKKTFLNDDATEQTFREAAPHARILHLATHSTVDNQNPLFSSIYFRRSPTDVKNKYSGRIFAYQLFELKLTNELVMLNSCESGSGSYLQGTGVVGISRALRYAGAQSLVLNLWQVNDMMASEFAVQFYKGINLGETKSAALQNAKLYFLKNKNANPHYWGSYMLLGNNSAIVKPYAKTNRFVAASFMIFFFSLAFASSFVEIRRREKA